MIKRLGRTCNGDAKGMEGVVREGNLQGALNVWVRECAEEQGAKEGCR